MKTYLQKYQRHYVNEKSTKHLIRYICFYYLIYKILYNKSLISLFFCTLITYSSPYIILLKKIVYKIIFVLKFDNNFSCIRNK